MTSRGRSKLRRSKAKLEIITNSRENRHKNWKERLTGSLSPANFFHKQLERESADSIFSNKSDDPRTQVLFKREFRESARIDDTSMRQGMKGYLKKKSKRGAWQKRWFKLKNSYLCYYHDDSESTMQCAINLREVDKVKHTDTHGTFQLILHSGGIYQLKADNRIDAGDWVARIEDRMAHTTVPASEIDNIKPNAIRTPSMSRPLSLVSSTSRSNGDDSYDAGRNTSNSLVANLSPFNEKQTRAALSSSTLKPTETESIIIAAFDIMDRQSAEVRLEDIKFSPRDMSVLCLQLETHREIIKHLALYTNGINEIISESTPHAEENGRPGKEHKAAPQPKASHGRRKSQFFSSLPGEDDSETRLSIRELTKALKDCKHLQTLWIGDNKIGPIGGAEVAAAVRSLPLLDSLYLDSNDLGHHGVQAIAEALHELGNLKTLEMMDNGMGPDGAQALGNAMESLVCLRSLRLASNNIGSAGCMSICRSLHHTRFLRELMLQQNDIDEEGAFSVARAIEQLPSLNTLAMGGNDIGVEGGVSIVRALQKCKQLKELDMHSTGLGDEGTNMIASILDGMPKLELLDLTDNAIGTAAGINLLDQLRDHNSKQLLALKLGHNHMGEGCGRVLVSNMLTFESLERLYVNDNELGENTVKLLVDEVRYMDTIRELRVGENGLSDEDQVMAAQLLLQSMPETLARVEGVDLSMLAGRIPELPREASTLNNREIMALYTENRRVLDNRPRSCATMMSDNGCVVS
uniref:PH domain-containing protein n=1 Tax=Phaeomonas parva TaxID=124430 RepID=A0A7S1U5W2_9STRA|mmetsp:Transcript_304/g.783  ORF Transcript_304/g.783 Transcript_304/m.783 type:complete len:749 (+) Transcript_304:351-2597(+)